MSFSASSLRSILMIAVDNSFAHVYDDVIGVREESDNGEKFDGPVEFFSSTGQRLAPVFGPDWRLEDLKPTSDPIDPGAVHLRLQAVVNSVRQYLHDHPEIAERAGLTLEQALATLPQLGLGGSIQDDIDAMPWHMRTNKGNFFHNLMHSAGWTH